MELTLSANGAMNNGIEITGGQTAGVGGSSERQTSTPSEKISPILGGENVVVKTLSAMEKLVMESQLNAAENTIKNLVDDPETRAEKAEKAKERREKEDLMDDLDREVLDKAVLQKMSDEIKTNKEEKV